MSRRRLARSLFGAGLVCAAVALTSATGDSRRADASCAPVYGSTATAAEMAPLSCQKIIDQTITSSHGPTHVTIWARTPSTPATIGPLAYRVLDIMRQSIAAYESFGAVSRDIAVAMGSGMGPWRETRDDREAAGVTMDAFDDNPRAMGEQCAIDLNLERTHGTLTPQGYRHFLDWVVAHEMFHCLQDFNWPLLNDTYSDNHAWWAEGQAEYFPALVLPRSIDASEWAQFPEASRIQDIFHMGDPSDRGYPNAVLFMYLDGPRYGSNALYGLFRDFPPTDDFDAQAAYLAAHSFDEIFDGFARAFADGEIPTRIPGLATKSIDPAFEGAPTPAGEGSVFFSANGAFMAGSPDVRPRGSYDVLHLYRGQFKLPAKKVFKVWVAGGGQTDIKPQGFDWIRSPAEGDQTTIETCEAPQVVTAVATTVDPHGAFMPEIKISEVSDGKPVCGEKDRCLIGRWHVDQAPLDRITRSLGARANAQISNGPIEIAFFGDGHWNLSFRNMTFRWQEGNLPARMLFAGASQGRWAASPTSGLVSSVMADATRSSVYLNNRRVTQIPRVASSFGMVTRVDPGIPYTCVGDTLTFSQGTDSGGLVYHRVSRDPASR